MRILTDKTYHKLQDKVDEGIAYAQRCEIIEQELALASLKIEQQENKIFLLQQIADRAEKFRAGLKRFLED